MLWSLLHPLLELLKYFAILMGAISVAMLVAIGLIAGLSRYWAGVKRRRQARLSLRAWADRAFPAVEWDPKGQRYLTQAEQAALSQRVDTPVTAPRQLAPEPMAKEEQPVRAPVAQEQLPLPPRPRRRGFGFERRY
jgi:hypothetical protein